ncbi:MAG TPA: hypothetical protein VFM51_02555 [Solirubrobacterales bacterium]|nr:hypothetical protein [Solirubrobacterales bacterium]
MRHLKMGLTAALAAMALIAFVGAGTASAGELWKSIEWWDETQKVGATLEASKQLGSTVLFEDTNGKKFNECTGVGLSLLIERAGENNSSFWHPNGSVQSHTYTGCSKTVDTIMGGKWEIINVPGTANGLFVSTGTEVTVTHEIFGVSCVYKTPTPGITTGTLTGNEEIGGTTTLDINGPLSGTSGGACPASARLTATYTVTNIKGLYVAD